MSLFIKNAKPPKQASWRKYWLHIILLLAIIIVAATYLFLNQRDNAPTDQNIVQNLSTGIEQINQSLSEQLTAIPQTLAEELAATRLYFMLSPKDVAAVQSFVFEDGAFSNAESDDLSDTYYSYSSDGSKAAFFALPKHRRDLLGGWGEKAALYIADTSGDNPAFPSLENATLLDATYVPFKQHVDISNAGNVVFIGWYEQSIPQVERASDWSVFTVIDGNVYFLTEGFMPKWRNDNEFYVLKDDGLYLANRESSMIDRVATSSEETVYSNNRIDISDDGTKLVWSQSHLAQIQIFDINADGTLTLVGSIPEKSYWSAFSPSGNYLAIQTTAPSATGYEENPEAKVEFFDMATLEKVPELEIDFDAFDQQYMFMTDWVIK